MQHTYTNVWVTAGVQLLSISCCVHDRLLISPIIFFCCCTRHYDMMLLNSITLDVDWIVFESTSCRWIDHNDPTMLLQAKIWMIEWKPRTHMKFQFHDSTWVIRIRSNKANNYLTFTNQENRIFCNSYSSSHARCYYFTTNRMKTKNSKRVENICISSMENCTHDWSKVVPFGADKKKTYSYGSALFN